MSYGEATRDLRDALTTLLTDHPYPLRRARNASSSDGISSRTDPHDTQAEYAALMQRYRLPVLQWALTTLNAAVPPRARATGIMWVAPAALRHKVRDVTDRAQKSSPRPTREQLAAPHTDPVVEAWRQAAVAAVRCLIEEHGALDGLSRADSLLAIRDTCDLSRALVILDDRCHSLPGWQHLSGGRYGDYSYSWGLLRAAERCAMWVNAYSLTPDLDGRGSREGDFDHHGTYHLREDITPGPYPPGTRGAIDALHNGLVRLQRPPSTTLVRHLLLRNFHLANELSRLARPVDQDSARSLENRASTYRALIEATTDLGGTGSRDPGVVQEFDTALALLKATKSAAPDDINVLHRLLTHSDRRLAHLIRDAIDNRTYLVARGTTVTRSPAGAGTQIRPKLVPITYNSARALLRAANALADHARGTRSTIEQPRPDTGLITEDALTHRDNFAAAIYARRRGATRIADRAGRSKGPQLRGLAHIHHNEITGPATPADVRAYLQYAVHNRPRHARRESPGTQDRSNAAPFQPNRTPGEDGRRGPGRRAQGSGPPGP
ncbi:hypothetical protein [Promicromonospora soli]